MCESIGGHSIIHSPSFTFLVGPKHTKLTIQSALAQHVSKPLHNLMNNGHTRESRHRIAVLEEEDVETFVAFCEYAYTGDYKVPQQAIPRDDNRIKAEILQSPTNTRNSWGRSQRSESFSSAVPPAPSPPPEHLDSSPQVAKQQIEPEAEPTIAEEPTAEAAAEDNAESPPDPPLEHGEQDASQELMNTQVEPEPEPEPEPQPVDAPASPEPEAPLEEPTEEPTEEPDAFEEPRALSAKEKKKARKAAMKKQRELQNLYLDEPRANPTPPSTPPLEPSTEEPRPETPSENISADAPVEEGAVATEEEATTPEQAEPEASPEVEPEAETVNVVEVPESEAQPAEPTVEPEVEPVTEPEGPDGEPQPAEPSEPVPEPEQAPEDHDDEVNTATQNDPIEEESWEEAEEKREDRSQTSEAQKPMIDMSFAKQPDASPRTPGLSLWDEFAALQYVDDGQAPISSTSGSPKSENFYPAFHAKVYVFATRYLIPALAQLCLRKLHGDLLNISITDGESVDQDADYGFPSSIDGRQVPMVLDLLRYAYFKTTRLEPINPTSATQLRENELRRLVVHFAACKVKELASYHPPGQSGAATPAVRPIDAKLQRAELAIPPTSLRVLLDMTPELASDLVYRMM